MDEQARTDQRRRSDSEDHQSLAATPSAANVYVTSRTKISFYDAKCRANNSPDSRCPGNCCSNCANSSCLFPRGKLYHAHGRYQVMFRNVNGQILCLLCANFFDKHGTWRSEAAVSTLVSAKALQQSARAKAQQLWSQHKIADPAFGPTKQGESASRDLPALLKSVCVTC